MRLRLKCKWSEVVLEVVSFDKATRTAVLRGSGMEFTDTNFHIEIVKRCYDLVQEE